MAERHIPAGYAAATQRRAENVLDALRLFVPWDLDGERKIRVGLPGDGSYVLVDRCRPTQAVLSFGIGPSVNFDLAMAQSGHDVFMFDHTIDALPSDHGRFTWIRQGLGSIAGADPALRSLEEHMAQLDLPDDDLILKIDIEGSEWDVLASLSSSVLRRFEQIVFEAHHLSQLEDIGFSGLVKRALSNLMQQFTLCHVHANNFCTVTVLADTLPVVDSLELTYIRTELVRPVPSQTFYPTSYDQPNFEAIPELKLWFYPFLPGSEMAPLPGC